MKELSLTTDLMFNRILAKNNFKYEDEETAKEEITKMLPVGGISLAHT